jgi:hypothetical protein
MKSPDKLAELLDLLAVLKGEPLVFNRWEWEEWPSELVAVLQTAGLLSRTRPATGIVCPGCEHQCYEPIEFFPEGADGRPARAYVFCTDPDGGYGSVSIPLEALDQWQLSGDRLADYLADGLSLSRPPMRQGDPGRWEIGLLKGAAHSSPLVMMTEDRLVLTLAGHAIPVADVLTLKNGALRIDRRELMRRVDHPAPGAGDADSPAQRRARLRRRKQELMDAGVHAWLKTLAEEEKLSRTRIKQLLDEQDCPAPK